MNAQLCPRELFTALLRRAILACLCAAHQFYRVNVKATILDQANSMLCRETRGGSMVAIFCIIYAEILHEPKYACDSTKRSAPYAVRRSSGMVPRGQQRL